MPPGICHCEYILKVPGPGRRHADYKIVPIYYVFRALLPRCDPRFDFLHYMSTECWVLLTFG